MTQSYSLDKAQNMSSELIGGRKIRRYLWRSICLVFTILLPGRMLKFIGVKNIEAFRSKWTLMTLFLGANCALLYFIFSKKHGTNVVAYVLIIPALFLILRFVLSIIAPRSIKGELPLATGHLAMLLPCYTETEKELKGTIKSMAENIAALPGNIRGCLFVVCDGIVVGKKNDRPTSEIVQDILGTALKTDCNVNYTSMCSGSNTCDIQSGYYGNMPYVKITKYENRGKRDSQIVLFNYLRGTQDNMSSVINEHIDHLGVSADFQFLFTTDSDTILGRNSLATLLEALYHDATSIAVCGNVLLANPHKNLLTLSQTFEYFFSQFHQRLAESRLGRVSCLPGCFSLFKLYERVGDHVRKPLLLKDEIIFSYAAQPARTLHSHNLMLGEDRYLTSLIMKYQPDNHIYLVQNAECMTGAPHQTSVLISQRRRWNNTAYHNLFDLMFLKTPIIMKLLFAYDLVSNTFQPAFYLANLRPFIGLLFYGEHFSTSLIYLASALFLPAILIITALAKKQSYVLKYFIFFILTTPLFYVVIPIICFWKMDDVSWGKTRKVRTQDCSDDSNLSVMSAAYTNWSTSCTTIDGSSTSGGESDLLGSKIIILPKIEMQRDNIYYQYSDDNMPQWQTQWA